MGGLLVKNKVYFIDILKMKNSRTFSNQVIETVKKIPHGKVSSYGRIAKICGLHRGGLLIGQILHHKSDSRTPWWRVVNHKGIISTSCLDHPAPEQASLLEKEDIEVIKDGDLLRVNINEYLWENSK